MSDFSKAELELIEKADADLADAGISVLEDGGAKLVLPFEEIVVSKPAAVKFRKDNYVRIDGSGEDGHNVGKVVSVKGKEVVLQNGPTTFTVARDAVIARISAKEAAGEIVTTDSNVTVLESPKAEVVHINKPEEKEENAEKKEKGPSKKSRAIEIFNETKTANDGVVIRKDVIKKYMEEIDLSKAGASTYYANIKLGKKGWTQ